MPCGKDGFTRVCIAMTIFRSPLRPRVLCSSRKLRSEPLLSLGTKSSRSLTHQVCGWSRQSASPGPLPRRVSERALEMGMPKTEGIRSISKLGLSMVTVVFDDSANTYFARQLVYERLQAVLGVSPQRRRSEGHGSTGPYWQHANSRDPVAVLSRTARSLPLCAGRRNALAPISNVPQRARASCINAIFLRDLS